MRYIILQHFWRPDLKKRDAEREAERKREINTEPGG